VRATATTCDSIGQSRVDADLVLVEHFRGGPFGYLGLCDQAVAGSTYAIDPANQPVCAKPAGRRSEADGGGERWALWGNEGEEGSTVVHCVVIGPGEGDETASVLDEDETCASL
jgi:hypothetical protein